MENGESRHCNVLHVLGEISHCNSERKANFSRETMCTKTNHFAVHWFALCIRS